MSVTESLKWSAQLHVAPETATNRRLQGDKITLPQSALESLLAAAPVVTLQNGAPRQYTAGFDPYNQYSFAAERQAREVFTDRQQQLPHPLTFRLVNPQNGRVVYAGIREFSAEEGQIGLSPLLRDTLGLETTSTTSTRSNTPRPENEKNGDPSEPGTVITVHHETIPKGTFLMLRPLEAGYDPEDWKSLLEKYIRENMTTMTKGEILTINTGRKERYRFLIDQVRPEHDAICVVDTDLEVDIQAMNEQQARETIQRRLDKAKKAPEIASGSSSGATIRVDEDIKGQVLPGEYVDFELKDWPRSGPLEISVSAEDDHEVDLLVSPFSDHLRAKPRIDEFMFADISSHPTKRVKLSPTNVEIESAESLKISIHAFRLPETSPDDTPVRFSLQVSGKSQESDVLEVADTEPLSDETICKNCKQRIPKRTLSLHEAFCYRNNVACSQCSTVFLKHSEAWKGHWHCPHDEAHGSGSLSRAKHDAVFHPFTLIRCPACDNFEAFNLPVLAQHRTSTCPAKEILCRFCHLIVPQQGPEDPSFGDAEVLLSGMTPHEYADGARTTECHICNRIVRLRDMDVHLRLHDRERLGRTAPRLCINSLCGRTIKAGEEARVAKEQLGLCNDCFGPLYITSHDPEGKALRRRVERRLLQQLMSGCGKAWCHNADWCRTGHLNDVGHDRTMTTKDALPQIRPLLETLAKGEVIGLPFCVDEAAQSRRSMAEMMSAEGIYELSWCVKSLEVERNDMSKARGWLNDRAPKTGETVS